ncbi:anti-sigma factor antagonist [Lentzea pudingi]|uniref:Anti-sigma factor antagonist n=1 Tax=Lentzea pudingi TaxID=1789439 RepID=A0ABQ2IVY8_9PSEU|nr:STAS domain-containing protein [Lentzea pudingi]GGN28856.1 anti-sigma factor antagonist [Lentzea pudingi]
MSTAFSTTTRSTPSGPVLSFIGELDSSAAPAAHDAIKQLPLGTGDQLVIDLTDLTFCDSSGIAALIAARDFAGKAGGMIALAAVPRHLSRVFGLLGLTGLFAIHATAAHAQRARIESTTER